MSLDVRKVYEGLPDAEGERRGYIRIIDESGEDYLFPAKYFVSLELPKRVEKAIEAIPEFESQHR